MYLFLSLLFVDVVLLHGDFEYFPGMSAGHTALTRVSTTSNLLLFICCLHIESKQNTSAKTKQPKNYTRVCDAQLAAGNRFNEEEEEEEKLLNFDFAIGNKVK